MNAKDFLRYYAKIWEARYGKPYIGSYVKEASLISNTRRQGYDDETLKRLMEFYIKSWRSDFADTCGRRVGTFVAQLPALVAAYAALENGRHELRARNITHERYELARKRARNEKPE